MIKNPHDIILKGEPKKQHLSRALKKNQIYLCRICKKKNDRVTSYNFITFKKKKRFCEVKNN